MSSTRITRWLRAPRSAVYAALTDPAALARWRFPDGMTSAVEEMPAGGFRVTLTYDAADQHGKTTTHSDAYRGSTASSRTSWSSRSTSSRPRTPRSPAR